MFTASDGFGTQLRRSGLFTSHDTYAQWRPDTTHTHVDQHAQIRRTGRRSHSACCPQSSRPRRDLLLGIVPQHAVQLRLRDLVRLPSRVSARQGQLSSPTECTEESARVRTSGWGVGI